VACQDPDEKQLAGFIPVVLVDTENA